MMICLNGEKREVPMGYSLDKLIESYQLGLRSIVIELNQKVIDRNHFAHTQLKEDDVVEIVHFVGGG